MTIPEEILTLALSKDVGVNPVEITNIERIYLVKDGLVIFEGSDGLTEGDLTLELSGKVIDYISNL